MMVDALRDPARMGAWIAKGGDAALASYAAILLPCRKPTSTGSTDCG